MSGHVPTDQAHLGGDRLGEGVLHYENGRLALIAILLEDVEHVAPGASVGRVVVIWVRQPKDTRH